MQETELAKQSDYPTLPSSKFTHNGLRQRVGRQDSSGISAYVTDGDRPGSDVLTDGQAVFNPGVSERRGGQTRYLKLDDSGSLRGQAAAGFTAAGFLTQDAFGVTVSQSGTLSGPFGFEADAQYQTDANSGLTLVGNRYYDAAIGRFIQSDPSGQEENEYVYAANNPLSFNDPSGLTYGPNKGKGSDTPAKPDPTPAKPTPPASGATLGGVQLHGFLGQAASVFNLWKASGLFPGLLTIRQHHHRDNPSKPPALSPGFSPYWNNYTKQWMIISPGYVASDDGKSITLKPTGGASPSPAPSAPLSNPPAPTPPPTPGKDKL